MCKRKRCRNKDCGALFVPCRQVPDQEYCSRKECQQARKREWNKKKLASYQDYKEARRAAQKRWKEKNPTYWQEYRARHPEYTRKNRQQQKLRNQKRQKSPPVSEIAGKRTCEIAGKRTCEIAKTDESSPIKNRLTGRYKIVPIHADLIAKTDECIVEIIALSG